MPSRAFLERRNALWRQLRQLAPGTPEFEAALRELQALTHWSRAQVLAGLGLAGLGLMGLGLMGLGLTEGEVDTAEG